MKYFIFKRENNIFKDILTDQTVKKIVDEKIAWNQHLMLGMQDTHTSVFSYITLKYGDDLISDIDLHNDFSPIPGVDYIQKSKPK